MCVCFKYILLVFFLFNYLNKTLDTHSFYICMRVTMLLFWKLYFMSLLAEDEKYLARHMQKAKTIYYVSIQGERGKRVLIC